MIQYVKVRSKAHSLIIKVILLNQVIPPHHILYTVIWTGYLWWSQEYMLQGLLNHVLDYSIKHLMVSWITFFQHVTTWAVIQSEWQVDNAALKYNLKCQAHYSIVLDWIPDLTYFTMYKLTVFCLPMKVAHLLFGITVLSFSIISSG